MSEENQMPEWTMVNKETNEFADKNAVSLEDMDRVAKMTDLISDDDLVVEKERIDKCSSSKSSYFYNMSWPDSAKAELKEYAMACGMNSDKFKAVDPSKFIQKSASVEASMVKTASATITLADPFKIDANISKAHEKSKWVPELKGASKLSECPTMSGIVPVRGGEDYNANSESKVAKGQNSISNPNAIQSLAESQEEDTGARLKRENKEKAESRKAEHSNWQKEKIDAMELKNILPNRSVFPTEVMNAQPGIRGEIFDFASVPEKTEGEKIKQANIDRKEVIRGKEKQKHDFITEKSPVRGISDAFAEELKKHLSENE